MTPVRLQKDKRIEILKGVNLFSECNKNELRRIASLTTEHIVKSGEVLATQGEPGSQFFMVIEGSAVASRNGSKLATFGPGAFFGELALLDGGERTATVVADSEMRVLVLTRREFQSLHSNSPSVAYKMLAELGSRLRSADEMIERASVTDRLGLFRSL
ncbi:MAG TPA: cyclic nucleotide-binding domain-containing protein [Acidimicrobiales bacterium]|nr:cyclic nucleotide-binding domain-containing protein [Acidimicrobiales bacterium]